MAAPAATPRAAAYPHYMDRVGKNFRGAHALALLQGSKGWTPERLRAAAYDPDLPAFKAMIPGLVEAGFYTNENVFDLVELPRRVLVIGGGPLGCELAQAFCRFGAQTTIAQEIPMFLPKEERDAAQIVSDVFARDGIEVRLNTTAVGVRVENRSKRVDLSQLCVE